MRPTIQDAVQLTRRITGLMIGALSPLALIAFLIGLFGILDRAGSHLSLIRHMEASGFVTTAVVWHRTDSGEIHVTFTGRDGGDRYTTLDAFTCPTARCETLTVGDEVSIYALPPGTPNFGRAILAEAYNCVRSDRPYLAPDLLGILGVSWALLVLKPQVVYAGLVDSDRLLNDGLGAL